ncbi:MAG: phosphoribosylanthranilate isomerase [Bacteroides sp.]|nr:phosphoribosylanthranilate isomerase [Bacteroides sp.]
MIIKICGMADGQSISEIAALKPAMMGFIFHEPSPRNACDLSPTAVAPVPGEICRVGVFVDKPVEYMLEVVNRYGLSAVQLHGKESPETCREMKERGLTVMKAVGIDRNIDNMTLRAYEGSVDMFVFDTAGPQHGGTGRKFDWTILRYYSLATPFLLSGGIGPEDAPDILKAAAGLPGMAGVDINSRFEITPGYKSRELVKSFVDGLQSSSSDKKI